MAYILDSDSLIKLHQVGALELVAANLVCVIPDRVLYETVTRARQ